MGPKADLDALEKRKVCRPRTGRCQNRKSCSEARISSGLFLKGGSVSANFNEYGDDDDGKDDKEAEV